MHPNIHSSISYDGRDMGTPKCLSTKEYVVYMMEYYLAIKKQSFYVADC